MTAKALWRICVDSLGIMSCFFLVPSTTNNSSTEAAKSLWPDGISVRYTRSCSGCPCDGISLRQCVQSLKRQCALRVHVNSVAERAHSTANRYSVLLLNALIGQCNALTLEGAVKLLECERPLPKHTPNCTAGQANVVRGEEGCARFRTLWVVA